MDRQNVNIAPMLIALLGALAVAIPVAVRSSAPAQGHVEAPLTSVSGQARIAALQRAPCDILRDFLGFKDDEVDKPWNNHEEAQKGYKIEFVIATLPEPFAFPHRSKFDSYLDAIQNAAEGAHYILDRFDLPCSLRANLGS
jgi:hypothetical protein